LRKTDLAKFPVWTIPMIYAGVTLAIGLVLPPLEYHYLPGYRHAMTVSAATAVFSSVASGMLAFTGIVFSLAFVMVQFSGTAYSPRLIRLLGRGPIIWHAMGTFMATFIYALVALIWLDRDGSGRVPFFSTWMVILLVIASVVVLALLMHQLAIFQVLGVMRFITRKGRQAINDLYPPLTSADGEKRAPQNLLNAVTLDLPVTQTINHTVEPMVVAEYDMTMLISLARQAEGLIVIPFGLGDPVIEGESLITVRGGRLPLPQADLCRSVRLELVPIFDQDPKYAIRLLVDIAIKALSPAVNVPTTAVQALNQIEDLLHRLGSRDLNVGQAKDETGALRVTVPAHHKVARKNHCRRVCV
jgi:uncharacterized membrane protein